MGQWFGDGQEEMIFDLERYFPGCSSLHVARADTSVMSLLNLSRSLSTHVSASAHLVSSPMATAREGSASQRAIKAPKLAYRLSKALS